MLENAAGNPTKTLCFEKVASGAVRRRRVVLTSKTDHFCGQQKWCNLNLLRAMVIKLELSEKFSPFLFWHRAKTIQAPSVLECTCVEGEALAQTFG